MAHDRWRATLLILLIAASIRADDPPDDTLPKRRLAFRQDLARAEINRRLLDGVDAARDVARAGAGHEALRVLRALMANDPADGPGRAAQRFIRRYARNVLRRWGLEDLDPGAFDVAGADAAVAEAVRREDDIELSAAHIRNLIELDLDDRAAGEIEAFISRYSAERLKVDLRKYRLFETRRRPGVSGFLSRLFRGASKGEPESGDQNLSETDRQIRRLRRGREIARLKRWRENLIPADPVTLDLVQRLARETHPESGIGRGFGGGPDFSPDRRPPDFFLEFLGGLPPGLRNLRPETIGLLMGPREERTVDEVARDAVGRAERIAAENWHAARWLLRLSVAARPGTEVAERAQRMLDERASKSRENGPTPPAEDDKSPEIPPTAPAEEDPSDAVFGATAIHDYEIELSDEAVRSLRLRPKEYVRARFREGKRTYEDVGVRLKGLLGSYRNLDGRQKPALVVKFNTFTPGQQFHGLKKIVLNNSVQSPSFFNEYVGYRLYRDAGVPAPRVGYANVSVNGERFGLYVVVEATTRDFLKRWFRDASGNLYEGPGDVTEWEKLELDTNQETGDRSDLQRLAEAIENADDDDPWKSLAAVVDLEKFATYLAVEMLIVHWDGYSMTNNYRVYHDPATDKFVFVPHGADQVLQRPETPVFRPVRGILARALLETDRGRDVFREHVMRVLRDVWDEERIREHIAEAYGRIRAHVVADPRRPYPTLNFEKAVRETLLFVESRPYHVLKELRGATRLSWRRIHPAGFDVF
ncbi:MAG: CotH kinase family protein, partial [Planctomycetota bacterium]|nr:CotH kinase family protein [Planctomycetota bacterium]